MRKFLIATHADFASGIKSALDVIIGSVENILIFQAGNDPNVITESEVEAILGTILRTDELVIFTDIPGGSITNLMLKHALTPNVHIVSGLNLTLLIDVILADTATSLFTVIESAIVNAKEQIVYVNKLFAADSKADQYD